MVAGRRLRFGEFELDLVRQQLLRDGSAVEIEPRPLRLLMYLVQHRDRIVPRQELFDVLWPDMVVSDSALSRAVYEARRALGDDASAQRWIHTARGRGVQFVGEVEQDPDLPASSPARPETRERRWIETAAAVAVVLMVVGTGGWALWPDTPPVPDPPATSILVLPFGELSPDGDHTWLASGMAQELIETLARVPQLEVKARTSGEVARRMGWDVPEIGRRAGVSKVIEGSVRREDGRVRVTVQLVDAATGFHLWSRSYDRLAAEILDLQRDIATAVARQLRVELAVRPAPTKNVEAWEEYRLGMALKAQGDLRGSLQAREHLERAISLDSGFAAPYAALASVDFYLCQIGAKHCDAARVRARSSIRHALRLDPELPLAQRIHAELLARDWDWAGAEKAERRALELGSPDGASFLLANLLLERGEIAGGLTMLEQLGRGGLTTVTENYSLGLVRQMMGIDLDRGVVLLERSLALSPEFWEASMQLYSIHRVQGRDREALQAFLGMSFVSPAARQELEGAFATRGWAGFDRSVLHLAQRAELGPLREPCGGAGSLAGRITSFYIRAGDLDGALGCLERAYEKRGIEIYWHLGTSWVWDPIRKDPRFQDILRGMGLAEMTADALPRVAAHRDCGGSSPSEIRCTELKPPELAASQAPF